MLLRSYPSVPSQTLRDLEGDALLSSDFIAIEAFVNPGVEKSAVRGGLAVLSSGHPGRDAIPDCRQIDAHGGAGAPQTEAGRQRRGRLRCPRHHTERRA